MAEYYYNGSGFVRDRLRAAHPVFTEPQKHVPRLPRISWTSSALFTAGRHYGFVRVSGKIDDTLSAAAWTQVNLQDLSGLTGIVLTLTHDKWSLNGSLMNAWGTRDTEAGLSPCCGEWTWSSRCSSDRVRPAERPHGHGTFDYCGGNEDIRFDAVPGFPDPYEHLDAQRRPAR